MKNSFILKMDARSSCSCVLKAQFWCMYRKAIHWENDGLLARRTRLIGRMLEGQLERIYEFGVYWAVCGNVYEVLSYVEVKWPYAEELWLFSIRHILKFCRRALCLKIASVSSFLPDGTHSSVKSVPLVWRLHSLSVLLLVGMGVLEEEKSRVSYEALQDLYGNLLHQARSQILSSESVNEANLEFLAFESDIHGTYSTFIETLVEQFSAVSYGDLIYGRQVAVYLHRCVESSVRLAAWNTLTNSRVLELLPQLENCFTDAVGYLEPVEDNSDILLAYVKSWTTGALDRAATRGSLAYTLVLHHVSGFIFESHTGDKLLLRNNLSRSLLQDFSSKRQHEAMMLNLIQYKKPSASQTLMQEDEAAAGTAIAKRLELLSEACEGSSSLLTAVERLKSSLKE